MISVCITNLGKYNEGELASQWLELPASSTQIEAALYSIGIDNCMYEEYFFADWESEVDGVQNVIGEYSSFRELNALALKLDELDKHDIEKLEAILDNEGCSDVFEALNLTQNLDSYNVRTDIETEEQYGEMLVEEDYISEIPDNLINYLDYEAIGRDYLINGNGRIGSHGFVEQIDSIHHEYSKYEDLPTQEEIDEELGDYQLTIQQVDNDQAFVFDR